MMDDAIVSLGERRVGSLHRLGDDEVHIFVFDREWLDDPLRPVLGQLFEDRRPRPIEASGMLAWFAHLLPPRPVRRWAERWARLEDDPPDIHLLLALGSDLPGAVVLEPGRPLRDGGGYAAPAVVPSGSFGFALPGAQWKLSVRDGDRGLVVPVRGEAGDFIAKFHSPEYPGLPRLEFATTVWAGRAGIGAHTAELVDVARFQDIPEDIPVGDGAVFLARRFDRTGRDRVHVEDFAQIMGRALADDIYRGSYEQLAALVHQLCPDDDDEFLRRLAFMICSGNGDAHLKNWGVHYPDGRHPRLSPAYDLVATVVLYPPGRENLALMLGGNRSFEGLETDRFIGLAKAMERDHTDVLRLLRTERDACEGTFSADLPYSQAQRERLESHLKRLPVW